MPEDLLDRFRHHDRRALARLLTLVDRGAAADLLTRLEPPAQAARVIAITGSAGVGKSTLVGALTEVIRNSGATVAVLACDPQSPLSGGALLGDRFRMPGRPQDEGVFIRSVATVGGGGAVASSIVPMMHLLEAYGFQVILLETVGAGQGDTAVRDLADAVVLLLQPEAGDDIQWEKAGVLEVADVVVIHKADLPGAERVESQVVSSLMLSSQTAPAVVRVSSRSGEGLEALWTALRALPLRRGRWGEEGRDLLRLAQTAFAEWFEQARSKTEVQALLRRWKGGTLKGTEAAGLLLRWGGDAVGPREP